MVKVDWRHFQRRACMVVIGGAGALLVAPAIELAVQQYIAPIKDIHISKDWTATTKSFISLAATKAQPADARADLYRKALDTIVSPTTNLATKSADWLAGYSDLLCKYGLALIENHQVDDAVAPLKAAQSIPYGTAILKVNAFVKLYKLKGDVELLKTAIQVADENAPQNQTEVQNLADVKMPEKVLSSELYIELAKLLASEKQYTAALKLALEVHHRRSPTTSDPLCERAAAAGIAGQLLFKVGSHDYALEWMQRSLEESQACQTSACRDTGRMAQQLLEKLQNSKNSK